ncbi:unnamed protein product, partial [Rotaria magnacalcarata]
CVSDFGMAHSDFWSEGRILIAGDSRVRRLMDNPDSVLDEKIDYAFQPGILVDELVDLVDGNLNEHHSIIILVGMIGDEIQKYVHHVSDGSSVNLFRSKECDATEKILIAVKAASDKWSSRKTGRMVMWTIPHYVDYVAYNSGKLGKFDSDESYEISLDSSRRFVNYVTRLKLRWVSSCPEVPFCLLNRVLFSGKRAVELYNSFSAVSAKDYIFPNHLLTDGLHPSVQMVKSLWKFLHKSVSDCHDKRSGKKLIVEYPSAPSVSIKGPGKAMRQRSRTWKSQPYVPKKIKLYSSRIPVHSRLSQPLEDETVEETFEEEPVKTYKNLSWKASTSGAETPSSSSTPLGQSQKKSSSLELGISQ